MINIRSLKSVVFGRKSIEERGWHKWFEVPISLEESLQSRDQKLMSCRNKRKERRCFSLIVLLFSLFSLYFIFLYDKNLREREGWCGRSILQ